MTPLRLLLCALALLPAGAAADFTLVQEVENGSAISLMTIFLQGDKMRSDIAVPLSIVVDAATGETLYLHHNNKTFSRVTAEEAKKMVGDVAEAQEDGAKGQLFATGQKKLIGSNAAELYTWSLGAMKMRLWISRDYPNGAAVQAQLDRLQRTGVAAALAKLMPPAESLPGLRLRTELDLHGQKVSYTILSVTEEPLAASLFAIPPGYTETPFGLPAKPPE